MKYKYALIRSVIGSGNSTVSKLVMMFLPTYPVLMARFFGGFLISIFKKEDRAAIKRDFKALMGDKKTLWMFLISIVVTWVNVLSFYYILNNYPLTISIIVINGAYLVFSVLMGRLIMKEVKSKKVYFFISLAIMALMVYIFAGSGEDMEISAIGILLMLFNAFGSTVENLLTASNLKKITSKTIIASKMLANTLLGLVLLMITKQDITTLIFDMTFWLAIGLLFLMFSGVITKLLEYKSMEVIGVAETAVFGILTFVFGAFISMFVFQEWLNIVQYISLALIVYALYQIQRIETLRKKKNV